MAINPSNLQYEYNSRAGGDKSSVKTVYSVNFSDNGNKYTFIPDSVINKGISAGDSSYVMPWFLNKDNLNKLGEIGQRIDLADQSWYGDWLKNNVGASTSGILIPAGSVPFDSNVRTIPGGVTGMAEADGQLVYAQPSSGSEIKYVKPDGQIRTISYKSGGGLFGGIVGDILSGVGNLILGAGPILPLALNFAAPGLGSAVAAATAAGTGNIQGALTNVLANNLAPSISGGISETVGGGALGSAIGQGLTSAGLAELQGGDAGQALLTGAVMGAANYVPPAQGMNSTLTPAQIESGIGTEGYGVGAQAQASGLFNPGVIGSQANTQTSYPIDMAELAAADAIQLTQQGIGIPAVEQNLVASGLDPLVAADMTQQIALTPGLTSTELANNLISTYGSNLYDTTIDQINEAAPKSTEQPVAPTSADINWGALAKGLMGLLAANQAAQAVPSVQAPITGTSFRPADTMPVYSPEYFQQVQQYYNTYLPSTPRDVATPLQQWYSSGYVEPDSVTAKLFSGG